MELELSHRARAAHLQHGRRVADVFLTSPRSSSRETSSGTKGIFVVMVRATMTLMTLRSLLVRFRAATESRGGTAEENYRCRISRQ